MPVSGWPTVASAWGRRRPPLRQVLLAASALAALLGGPSSAAWGRYGSSPTAGGPAARGRGRGRGRGPGRAALGGPGAGYMLFDLEGFQKDGFQSGALQEWLPTLQIPSMSFVTALEWWPVDGKVITVVCDCLQVGQQKDIRRYWACGSGWDNYFKDNFPKTGPFSAEGVNVKYVPWTATSTALEGVPNDSVDLAVCTHGAAERLGPDASLGAALRETHRVLRPTGQFVLYSDGDGPLPGVVEELFAVEATKEAELGEEDITLRAYKLTPKDKVPPPAPRLRRRRRKVPPPTAGG